MTMQIFAMWDKAGHIRGLSLSVVKLTSYQKRQTLLCKACSDKGLVCIISNVKAN
jgi:hypothetical protein